MEPSGRIEFIHRSWPADPAQLAAIRRQLARWLEPLQLTEDETADVVLAVDEAVANAVRHAAGAGSDEAKQVELTLWTEPGSLSIEIVDHSRWRAPDFDGRGISLMNRMVESVLIHNDERGGRILLRAPMPGSAEPGPRHAVEAPDQET